MFIPSNHGREGGSSHQTKLWEGKRSSMSRVKLWRLMRHADTILLY